MAADYVTIKVPRWVYDLAQEVQRDLVERGVVQLPRDLVKRAQQANGSKAPLVPGLGMVIGLALLSASWRPAKRKRRTEPE